MEFLNPHHLFTKAIRLICHSTNRIPHHPRLVYSSPFTTTAHPLARDRNRPKIDQRISLYPSWSLVLSPVKCYLALIRYFLSHPLNPRPLRFSRLRALRHWTIHRAAQLHHHAQRHQQERELERHYNAMRAAMEELRVGAGDSGKLYRRAVQRRGIFGGLKMAQVGGVVGNGGIPLEYARGQVDRPSREGWDESWVRG